MSNAGIYLFSRNGTFIAGIALYSGHVQYITGDGWAHIGHT